ncbi:TolC family protein [Psychroflexus sediminis]|uniref:Outer membrane protein TolC n=1 Tax=Psychroflexus sediminis TaxID=470826 RepID=A0A1G7U5P0_9FLAO|nr:TolC family protein [Psychroflexus sediminis]SDG42955.1 Outer membrane protein TolC [Psychroflexus sediminis]
MRVFSISILTFILSLCSSAPTHAQELLSKKEAITQMLSNNFGIQLAENQLEIADNNQGILNSGYLPRLTGNAGGNYTKDDQDVTFRDGEQNSIVGAETTRYNASINLNYTLFDGLGRFWNYKRLKEEYDLSSLEARQTIETTMLQLFTVYYEVARLTENEQVLQQTYKNTKQRLKRAEYNFQFGQVNKLEVLNAEVDLVNDSINLMNNRQLLKNAKRDLNVVINSELEQNFEVDTLVSFTSPIQIENFVNTSQSNNVRLLQAEKNITISDYDYKASKAVFLPSIGLTGSYGWNEGNFPVTSFATSSTTTGVSGGISLTWDLFDGGSGITRMKNAKINYDNQQLVKAQIRQQVKRDISNALGNYHTRLEVLELQTQNILTAKNNFERSNEQYKLGQITSVELRQAQINLLNAQTSKNLAKYDAKIAELELLQLTGQLLNVDF